MLRSIRLTRAPFVHFVPYAFVHCAQNKDVGFTVLILVTFDATNGLLSSVFIVNENSIRKTICWFLLLALYVAPFFSEKKKDILQWPWLKKPILGYITLLLNSAFLQFVYQKRGKIVCTSYGRLEKGGFHRYKTVIFPSMFLRSKVVEFYNSQQKRESVFTHCCIESLNGVFSLH